MFRHLTRNKNLKILLTGALLSIFCAPVFLYALPEVENVAEGTVSIEQPDAVTLNITSSDKAIINYKQFNIAENETVRFIQPDSLSAALNRDLSGAISQILGRLFANGSIILVNTAGINIGANADINVASIIASTLNISDDDFLSGNYKFFRSGENAFILNKGKIVTNGGYVGMLSGAVENQGTIIANLGTVVLASGEEMTLALDDLNQISVVIDKGVQSEVLGFDGGVKNSGTITANGGKVVLTAKVLNKVFDYAVNNTGVIEAGSVVERNGVVELIGEGAPVLNVGQILASGLPGLGVDGGRISIEAAAIMQKGLISANCIEGGTAGEVEIVSQASTVLDSGSTTEARAVGLAGNGGRVTVNSTGGNTVVNKNAVIDVSAGAISGDAGFIEVSAFDQLGFYGVLNGRAPPGYKIGTFLIDPPDLKLGGTANGNLDVISSNDLLVIGDLTVNDGWLTLTATGNFSQDFGVIKTTSPTVGDITINANNVTVRAVQSAKNLTINATSTLTIASTWGYKDTFTVSSLSLSGDLTNFPVLVKLIGPAFDFSKAKTDGSDIRFVDSNGAPLSYEIEKWTATEAYIWVKLPTLNASTDTVFYMYHDSNPALPADAYNIPANVWSNGYAMVQHDPSALDSTANNNDGTAHNVANDTGKIGDAGSYNGTDSYIAVTSSGSLTLTTSATLSAWINPSVGFASDYRGIIYGDYYGNSWDMVLNKTTGSLRLWFAGSPVDGITSLPFDTWSYVTATYDGVNVNIYINGALDKTAAKTGTMSVPDATGFVGTGSLGTYKFLGLIDEAIVSNVARTADWVKASYITENGPATSDVTTAVTGGLSAANTVELTAGGAIVDDNPVGIDVTATNLLALAVNGIGSSDPLETAVDNLLAQNTDLGDININNTGDLTILGVENNGGNITINAASSILVRYSIEAAGNIFLAATSGSIYLGYLADIIALGHDITLTAGGEIARKNLEVDYFGLVGYWKLDGNANDSSGNGNDGTGSGGVGYVSDVLSLDGIDDLITVPYSLSLDITGAITIEGWINLNSFTQQSTVAGKWTDISGANLRGYLLTVATDGTPRFYISNTGADYPNVVGSALSTGDWYHLVGTYDGAALKLYIDGALDAQTSQTGTIYLNNESLLIGANDGWGGSSRKFTDGSIDDVRVYNRALSDIEIYAHSVVTPGTGVIRGGNLVLSAGTGIGSAAEPIQTTVTTLAASTAAGDIYIKETDDIILNTISAPGIVDIEAAGLIDGDGTSSITAGTKLTLTAGAGIGSGTALATIATDIWAYTTSGNIQIDNTTGAPTTADTTAGGNILFNQAGGGILTIKASAGGDAGITVDDGGDLIIEQISAANEVDLAVYDGSIIDGNPSTGPPYDITATNLILSATKGIGSGDAIETAVTNLQATNSGTGNIEITNDGLLNVYNTTTSGTDIIIQGNNDIYVHSISTDGTVSGSSIPVSGTVTIVTSGSIEDYLDENSNPDDIYDISAHDIVLNAAGGIGTVSLLNPTTAPPVELRSATLSILGGGVVNLYHKGTLHFYGFDGTGFTFINAGDLYIESAIKTNGGPIDIRVENDPNLHINANLNSGGGDTVLFATRDIFINAIIRSVGGAVDITARRDIVQNGDIITKGGDLAIRADSNKNLGGVYELSFGNEIDTTSVGGDGKVVISADDVNIDGIIDAGTANVTLKPSDGQAIALTGNTGTFKISNEELDNITAGKIIIGSHQAGTITIKNLDQPGVKIELVTNGDVFEQGQDLAADIILKKLILDVDGDVGKPGNPIETEIEVLQGRVGGLINLAEYDNLALNQLMADEVILKTGIFSGQPGYIIDNNGGDLNIIATSAILDAKSGIDLDTQITQLNARVRSSGATGDISIDNQGDLTLVDLAGWGFAVKNNGSGGINISTASPLTVNADVIGNNNIDLSANGATEADITVNANITSLGAGIVTLYADSDITHNTGVISSIGGTVNETAMDNLTMINNTQVLAGNGTININVGDTTSSDWDTMQMSGSSLISADNINIDAMDNLTMSGDSSISGDVVSIDVGDNKGQESIYLSNNVNISGTTSVTIVVDDFLRMSGTSYIIGGTVSINVGDPGAADGFSDNMEMYDSSYVSGSNVTISTRDDMLMYGSSDITATVDVDIYAGDDLTMNGSSSIEAINNNVDLEVQDYMEMHGSSSVNAGNNVEIDILDNDLWMYDTSSINADNDIDIYTDDDLRMYNSSQINAVGLVKIVVGEADIDPDNNLTMEDYTNIIGNNVDIYVSRDMTMSDSADVTATLLVTINVVRDFIMNSSSGVGATEINATDIDLDVGRNMVMNQDARIDATNNAIIDVQNNMTMNNSSKIEAGTLANIFVDETLTMNGSSSIDPIDVLLKVNRLIMNSSSNILGYDIDITADDYIAMNGTSRIDADHDIDIDVLENSLTMNNSSRIIADNNIGIFTDDDLRMNNDSEINAGATVTLIVGMPDIDPNNDLVMEDISDIYGNNVIIKTEDDVFMYDSSDIIAGTDVDIDAGGEVVVSNSTIISGQDVFIDAVDNISLGVIQAGRDIRLNTTAGSIVDTNVDAINLTAPNLYMEAYGSIGSVSDRIDTNVADIYTAFAYHGDVGINELNGVNFWDIQALGSTVDIITGGDAYAYYIYAGGTGVGDPARVNILVNPGSLYVLLGPATSGIYALQTTGGDAEIHLNATVDISIVNSTVAAEAANGGDALIDIDADGDILIDHSHIEANVGSGSADVGLDAGDSISIIGAYNPLPPTTVEAIVAGDGNASVSMSAGLGGISITDDLVHAKVGGSGDATINMSTPGSINLLDDTTVFSEIADGMAMVMLYAGGDINIGIDSVISALSNNEYALILMTASGAIDARGLVFANADYSDLDGDGLAGILMLAYNGDIYAGNVVAYGTGDAISLIEGYFGVNIGTQYNYGSGIALVSLNGDITLGYVSADAVVAAAVNGSIMDEGDVIANYLLLFAKNDIGTADDPIRTQVKILSAISWDTGDIYILEADDIELGLYLPIFNTGPTPAQIGALGISVAANNGIIHILSNGDMLVNSVISPNGGVLLFSLGSIYAGRGWCPAYTGIPSGLLDYIIMDGWSTYDGPDGFWAAMYDNPDLPVGPNVIAGGYSLFATPNGTIGVGDPRNPVLPLDYYNPLYVNIQFILGSHSAFPFDFDGNPDNGFQDPPVALSLYIGDSVASTATPPYDDGYHGNLGISGALKGIVRPGVYANPGYLNVTTDEVAPLVIGAVFVDGLSFVGVPPGYVFHDDNATACAYPLTGYLAAVNSTTATTYLLANQIWPPVNGSPTAYLLVLQWLPPVLEHMLGATGVQVTPIDLMTSNILARSTFFYHPLTPYDMSAFGEFVLEEGAYDFIEGNLSLGEGNGWLNSLISQDEEAKKKKKGTQ